MPAGYGGLSWEACMDVNRIWAVYFSPTGGTKDITMSVAAQLGETGGKVFFEWNEGGHFHDIEGRFVKAIMWWMAVE